MVRTSKRFKNAIASTPDAPLQSFDGSHHSNQSSCHMCGLVNTSRKCTHPPECQMQPKYCSHSTTRKLDCLCVGLPKCSRANKRRINGSSTISTNISQFEESLPFRSIILCNACYYVIQKMQPTYQCNCYSIEGSSCEATVAQKGPKCGVVSSNKRSSLDNFSDLLEIKGNQNESTSFCHVEQGMADARRRSARILKIKRVDNEITNSKINTKTESSRRTSKNIKNKTKRGETISRRSAISEAIKTLNRFPTTDSHNSSQKSNFSPSDFLEVVLKEQSSDPLNMAKTSVERNSNHISRESLGSNISVSTQDSLNNNDNSMTKGTYMQKNFCWGSEKYDFEFVDIDNVPPPFYSDIFTGTDEHNVHKLKSVSDSLLVTGIPNQIMNESGINECVGEEVNNSEANNLSSYAVEEVLIKLEDSYDEGNSSSDKISLLEDHSESCQSQSGNSISSDHSTALKTIPTTNNKDDNADLLQTVDISSQCIISSVSRLTCCKIGEKSLTINGDPLAIALKNVSNNKFSGANCPSGPYGHSSSDDFQRLDENNESESTLINSLPGDEETPEKRELSSKTQCIKPTSSRNEEAKRLLEGTWDFRHSDDDSDEIACHNLQNLPKSYMTYDHASEEPQSCDQSLGCSGSISFTNAQNEGSYSRKAYLNEMLSKIDKTLKLSFQPLLSASGAIETTKNAERGYALTSSSVDVMCQPDVTTLRNQQSPTQGGSSVQIESSGKETDFESISPSFYDSLHNSLLDELDCVRDGCTNTSTTSLESNIFENLLLNTVDSEVNAANPSSWNLDYFDDVISLSPPLLSPISDKSPTRHEFIRRGSPHPFVDYVNSSTNRTLKLWGMPEEPDGLDTAVFSDDSQL